jgi:tetratricopeptide (TPR) repeat protein
MDWLLLGHSLKTLFRKRWPMYAGMAVVACYPLLAHFGGGASEAGLAAARAGAEVVPRMAYLRSQPGVILQYLRLAFWPWPQCFDYAWPVVQSWRQAALPSIAVAVLLVATLWGLIRRSGWALAGVWFFVILAPTSSLMPLGDLAAEHRMYLPLAAVVTVAVIVAYAAGAAVLGGLLRSEQHRRAVAAAVASLALAVPAAALGYRTYRRNRLYHTDLALWRDTVRHCPENARAHLNYGSELRRRGDVESAAKHFREAIRLDRDYITAWMSLVDMLVDMGRPRQALQRAREAAEAGVSGVGMDFVRGRALRALGRDREAARLFEAVINAPRASDERRSQAATSLGLIHLRHGRPDDAAAHFRFATELHPRNARAQANLGKLLMDANYLEQAEGHLHRAVELEPQNAVSRNWLAICLARRNNLPEAIRHWEAAVRTDPAMTDAMHNLVLALRSSRPARALDYARRLVAAQPGNTWARQQVRALERQLRLGPSPLPPVPATGASHTHPAAEPAR